MAAQSFIEFLDQSAPYRITVQFCDLYPSARESCAQQFPDTQLLYGEDFTVLNKTDTQFYGISKAGAYTGWIDKNAVQANAQDQKIACVSMPYALIYQDADIKSSLIISLPMGAFINISIEKNGFYYSPPLNGWVHHSHILQAPIMTQDHFTHHAQKYLNAPYRYGGRTAMGIDCSALVQIAARLCGIALGRDTKDQIAAPYDIDRPYQKGDIVHFKHHVGIMLDNTNFINATDRHMAVVIEPIDFVINAYSGRLAHHSFWTSAHAA